MVPAAVVQPTLDQLVGLLRPDDVIIDGGNSYYRDDITRAKALTTTGSTTSTAARAVACGASTGVLPDDRRRGRAGRTARSDLQDDRAGRGQRRAHPGRTRTDGTAQDGYLHCGPSGAGHFVKMVHNGIEYGMMAAIAEGLNIIAHANAGNQTRTVDAGDHPAA